MDKQEALALFDRIMYYELKDIKDEILKQDMENLEQYIKALIKQDIERSPKLYIREGS